MKDMNSKRFYSGALFVLLTLFVGVSGVLSAVNFASGTVLETAFFSLFSLLLIPLLIFSAHPAVLKGELFGSLVLVALVALVSAIFAPSVSHALFGLAGEFGSVLSLALLTLLFVIGASLGRTQNTERLLLISLTGGIVFVSLTGALLALVTSVSFIVLSFFAGTAVLLLAFLLDVHVLEQRSARIGGGAVLVGLLSLLALIGTPVVLWGVLAGVLLLIGWVYLRADGGVWHPAWALIGVAVTVGLFAILTSASLGPFIGKSVEHIRPSVGETIHVTLSDWSESTKNMVIGSGTHSFAEMWELHRTDAMNMAPHWSVTFSGGFSTIATVIATTGLVGAFVWLILLSLIVRVVVRILVTRPTSVRTHAATPLAVLAAIIFTWAAVTLLDITMLGVASLSLGMAAGLTKESGKGSMFAYFQNNRRVGTIVLVVLAITFFGGLTYSFRTVNFALLYQVGVSAFETEQYTESADALSRVVGYREHHHAVRLLSDAQQRQIDILVAAEDPSVEDRVRFANVADAAVANAKRATKLNPYDYRNWVTLGNVYTRLALISIEGAYTKARDTYSEAVRHSPENPIPNYLLARLAVLTGQNEDLIENLEAALRKKSNYQPALNLQRELAERTSDGGGVPMEL